MKRIHLWFPPEYQFIFWFGIIVSAIGLVLTLSGKTTWVLLVGTFLMAFGRWTRIKESLEDFFEILRSILYG